MRLRANQLYRVAIYVIDKEFDGDYALKDFKITLSFSKVIKKKCEVL